MRNLKRSLAASLVFGIVLGGILGLALTSVQAQESKTKEVIIKSKPKNPERIKGMKAALADIEAGFLKQKFPPFPDAVQHRIYLELLQKELGVQSEVVPIEKTDEMNGYNDVMRVEIEYRFGAGILDRMEKNAAALFEKSIKKAQ